MPTMIYASFENLRTVQSDSDIAERYFCKMNIVGNAFLEWSRMSGAPLGSSPGYTSTIAK